MARKTKVQSKQLKQMTVTLQKGSSSLGKRVPKTDSKKTKAIWEMGTIPLELQPSSESEDSSEHEKL